MRSKGLFAEVQLLENLGVFGQVVLLEVIEKLATAAGHLEEPAARVEVLAVGPEVIGQMIDPGGEQRDLDFGRAGVLIVGLVLSDDFGFNDGVRHGLVVDFQDCRGPSRVRAARPAATEIAVEPASPFQSGGDRTSHGGSPQPANFH